MKKKKMLFGAILIFIIMSAFIAPVINETPDKLPKIPEGFYSWDKVKQIAVSMVTAKPNSLCEFNGQRTDANARNNDKFFKDLMIDYGVLNTSWLEANRMPTKEIWVVVLSDKLRRVMYDWCKPDYLAEFSKLSTYHQEVYIEIFEHAQKYLSTFSYVKELKYLEQIRLENSLNINMVQAIKDDPDYYRDYGFTRKGPDGNTKFRRLECFIFRRVHKNGIMPADMLKLVNQIVADLKAVRAITTDVESTIIKLLPDSLVKNIPIYPTSEAVICSWALLDRHNLVYLNWDDNVPNADSNFFAHYLRFLSCGDSTLNTDSSFFVFKRDEKGNLYYLVRSGKKLTFSEDDLYCNVVNIVNFEYKNIEEKGRDGKPCFYGSWVRTNFYKKSFGQKINKDSLNMVMAESVKILSENSKLR